ncbi:MAG TPA: CGNR zinc finger domain-containing protein [Vicinamibacterales bacterium]|nr:CGNR zinc finger domain-containing protein [Vicinamibacterales bacterium]
MGKSESHAAEDHGQPLTGRLPFAWVSGHPALDFLNTVSWRSWGLENERLANYSALSDWAATAGLLDPAALPATLDTSATATRALAEALHVRRQLHDFFIALARQGTASTLELAALNGMIADTTAKMKLAPDGTSFRWTFTGDHHEWPVRRVIWASAELLTSPRLMRLRECGNPECGWLFLDESRRRNRRWCTMIECGSRAKARRYYQRKVTRRTRGERLP